MNTKTRINQFIDIIIRAFTINLVLLTIIFCIPTALNAQRININHHYPVIMAENRLWFGTPDGLFQYNSDDNSFKRFNISSKNTTSDLKQLYYNDEILWCVTDSSLTALHIRLNEKLIYNTSSGLPSNIVNGLALQEDYVWIATDNGAARFDLLIEEWDVYDELRGIFSNRVIDIITIDDKLWFAVGNSLSEYNPMFEKWRHYNIETDSVFIIKRGFSFDEEIWLVGSEGMLRFNPELQTQQKYFQPQFSSDNLLELFIENDMLWAVTRTGLFNFSKETGIWKAFEGNSYLEDAIIITAHIDPSEIWVLLEQEVRVWNRSENNWEIIDYASGLSGSHYQALYVDGGVVFLINSDMINYRLSKNDVWRKHKISRGAGSVDKMGRRIFGDLFDNEAGGHIDLGKSDWSWEGTRITYIRDYKKTITDSGEDDQLEVTSGERLDIKSRITLNEYQTISGYYNNIDYSETEYGIRYRNQTDAYLREFNWGDFKRETGENPFAEEVSLFGSNIWMRAGSKTSRFKRSQFNLKAFAGEQQSRKTYEYYQGATNKIDISFADTNYLKNQFYIIPGQLNLSEIGQISIYVDDLNYLTNTENTLTGYNIAGITGDYDLLIPTEDYYIFDEHGMIRFTSLISTSFTVVIQYTSEGIQSEAVLQYDSTISTACKNVYYLGGTGIIPYSFNLEISDSIGNAIPIQNCQIDNNGDSFVDSDRIDYQNGLLIFPAEQPFPPDVYDSEQPQSYYQLHAEYQTELSLIQLQNRGLVRGSEKLKLDGSTMTAGDDYVLDYTNGTLVFVKEGIVSTDTRIEIEYQYYLEEFLEQVYGAQFSWNPSDNLLLQSEWLQFTDYGDTLQEANSGNLFTLNSEIRQNIGDFDLKIIPGLAYNTEDNGLSGIHWEGLISSSKFRFHSKFRNFTESYRNLYRPRFTLGDIRQQRQFGFSADIREDIRISGDLNQYHSFNNESSGESSEQTGNVALHFHRSLWPVWQFSYQDFHTESSVGKSTKSYFQVDLEYQLPKSITKRLQVHDIKLDGTIRNGKQSGLSNLGIDKSRFNLGNVRLNTSISERFQGSFYYRRDSQIDNTEEGLDDLMYRAERLLIDFDHNEWRVLQTYLRLENKIRQNLHPNSNGKDFNFSNLFQLNLRFAPGRIYHPLSLTHFEFSLNQSRSIWGSTCKNIDSWIWNFFKSEYALEGNTQDIRDYYIKNELNLSSRFLLTSLAEWNNQKTELSASGLNKNQWSWTEKLNLKLNYNTRFNFQYRQYYQNWGYDRTDKSYEPSTWIEYRWTPDFQNTYYLLFRKSYKDNGNIRDNIDNWEARYDIVWRRNRIFIIRQFEIRQSFSWSHVNNKGDNRVRTYQYGSTSSIDLYPLHSTILRFQFNLTRNIDDIISANDYWNVNFNLKFSLRF